MVLAPHHQALSLSMVASLAESLALAKLEGNDPARCGYDLCKAIVIGVREGRVSRPDLVVKYGQYLLQKFAGRLGHEVWPMYEQTFVALLQYASAPDGEGGAAAEMAQVRARAFPHAAALLSWPFPHRPHLLLVRRSTSPCSASSSPTPIAPSGSAAC